MKETNLAIVIILCFLSISLAFSGTKQSVVETYIVDKLTTVYSAGYIKWHGKYMKFYKTTSFPEIFMLDLLHQTQDPFLNRDHRS